MEGIDIGASVRPTPAAAPAANKAPAAERPAQSAAARPEGGTKLLGGGRSQADTFGNSRNAGLFPSERSLAGGESPASALRGGGSGLGSLFGGGSSGNPLGGFLSGIGSLFGGGSGGGIMNIVGSLLGGLMGGGGGLGGILGSLFGGKSGGIGNILGSLLGGGGIGSLIGGGGGGIGSLLGGMLGGGGGPMASLSNAGNAALPQGGGNPFSSLLGGGSVAGMAGNGGGALGSLPGGVQRWAPLIQEAAQKYGVSPSLVAAVMHQESRGNPMAGSHAGAKGLMQFMPGTFSAVQRKFGIQGNIFDPRANVMAGAAHLSELSQRYGGDLTKVLAAYNAGPGNVGRWQNIAETRNYVPSVLNAMRRFSM